MLEYTEIATNSYIVREAETKNPVAISFGDEHNARIITAMFEMYDLTKRVSKPYFLESDYRSLAGKILEWIEERGFSHGI